MQNATLEPAVFDLSLIEPFRADGYISTKRHPVWPLLIHNYTQRCQFDQVWNDVTLQCRGLITDENGYIVARPFRKFFNIEEHFREGSTLPAIDWNQEFYVSEKLDGSLGIVFMTPHGPEMATRGSFDSDQAKFGTRLLKEKYSDWRPCLEYTYLFEIIYPENRIVVDYGDLRDIVLLDVVHKASGRGCTRGEIEAEARHIGCQAVRHVTGLNPENIMGFETGEANREGIVVRFDDGSRVKIKLAEYKRLHRLITGLNARKVWECLSAGTALDLERVPDEFFRWVEKTKAGLIAQFDQIAFEADCVFITAKGLLGDAPRKSYAELFKTHPKIAGLLFLKLDGRDVGPKIWDMIYPEHSPPWMECAEEA